MDSATDQNNSTSSSQPGQTAKTSQAPYSLQALLSTYKKRYLVGLAALALLATLSTLVVHIFINTQAMDAYTINVAGKQRMLSQRLALMAHTLTDGLEQKDAITRKAHTLQTLASTMKEDHTWLLNLETTQSSDALRQLYLSESSALSQRVLHYTQDAEALAQSALKNQPTHTLLETFSPRQVTLLLNDLDQAVKLYEEKANAKIQRLQIVQLLVWVSTLLCLLLVARIILHPVISLLRDTYEKLEQQLLQAQQLRQEAQQAALAKSQFLATMSHEIRTPMNGVLGMLGLLSNTRLDDHQKHRVRVAQNSANALLTVINDILDFSKIEANKIDIEVIDFDLRALMGEIIEHFGPLAEEKNIELILDGSGINVAWVKGDPGRIRQILSNLLSNALKFVHEGEILLTVMTQNHNLDSDLPTGSPLSNNTSQGNNTPQNSNQLKLSFSVRDTGIGISQTQQEKLFDAFTQADSSTTRKFGGTGLGLSIVKRLCELMQGEIGVKSELGQGAEFYGGLLLQQSEHTPIALPKADISNLHVLVVDDNETNREIIGFQLSGWVKHVEISSSGQEAIERCQSQRQERTPPFDAIIIDMHMPDMDGTELAKHLKGDEQLQDIALVMMTSSTESGNAQFFSELGFSAFFSKPATQHNLLSALKIVVEHGQALASANPLITAEYIHSLSNQESSSNNLNNSPNTVNDSQQRQWQCDGCVLVVEDNPVNQEIVSMILGEHEIPCLMAGNGQEAIDYLKDQHEEHVCVIMMDCQMPVMDGFEATERIRKGEAGEQYRNIPIIATTAHALKGDDTKCFEAGMSDYATKPIEPEQLLSKLYKWSEYDSASKLPKRMQN